MRISDWSSDVFSSDLFEADRRARHQRLARTHARGIDREADRKIVSAIEHDVGVTNSGQTVIGTEGLDLDLAIERHQLRGGGIRLGTANIALAIQGLALQIADFDALVVAPIGRPSWGERGG